MLSTRRSKATVAVAAATVAGAVGWTAVAGAASALDVIAVIPSGDTVSMVVSVDPPPSLSQPGSFQVSSGDTGKLSTDARAVIGPQLSTGVVLDTSTDGASALQAGINGATQLLLQLPDGARTVVVGDGGDQPSVLSPLSQGAVASVGGVTAARSGGTRHTGDALTAAVSALPAANGQTRLLLLYTGGADAGGEAAATLGRRLADAGIVLAVVATGADQDYWKTAAAATGGVLVPGSTTRPFDRVTTELRQRFVLTFPRPGTLPATVKVAVTVGSATTEQSAVVPADSAGPGPPGPASPEPGSPVPWWIVGGVLVVAVIGAALYLAQRRMGRSGPEPRPLPATPDSHADLADPADVQRSEVPLPRRTPANGESAISGAARAVGTELPRRQPGSHPLRPAATRLPVPAQLDPEQTVEIPRPRLGDGARKGRPGHPAADERAYSRLDEVTAQSAAAVDAGTLDFRHAVARIAMAAPGRVDLLDRVIEVERRLAGVQIGNSAPTEIVLRLLTAARRVVAGEVALVDPSGVRVEQTAQILRLVRPDRTTKDYRSAKELARHVDLSTLTADAPAS